MNSQDRCFIITPIGDDSDPIRRHIEGIIDAAIRPALCDKYELVVAHKISEPGSITKQIIKEILYLIFDYPHKHYTFKYFEV